MRLDPDRRAGAAGDRRIVHGRTPAELVDRDGRLPKIAGIGPASARVIHEVIETGGSPTVERAIEVSERPDDIERRRALRRHFLSRAEVLRVLRDPRCEGPCLDDYRGDLQMHSEWSDGVPALRDLADAVRILAHPRGRISGSRAGVVADWDAVFRAARQRGVAVELDGDPARQDLDHTLGRQALAAGCLFARQDSSDRIVNCWPLDRLLAWLD